ncbi:MAG TPA: hypothetical protein VHD85_13290 [Terracidiphilus sp.]|nr:hypothetical protein [Terracidiphilus sp.]
MLIASTIPVFAGTTISSPVNGTQVSSPFNVNVWADTCSSIPASAVGFSLDNSANSSIVSGQSINTSASSGEGWHTLHVKVWNGSGGVCVTDVSIDVVASGGTSVVPSNAISVSSIQTLGNWFQIHDGGTPGTSSGWTGTQNSPSMSGNAREFATNFTDFGGQRYSVQFGDDTQAENFLYDAWVYIYGSASGLANLEFDLNQTMPSGETALMGFQCDGWTNTWDYTVNGGSPTASWDTWLHSYASCNPHAWAPNQWHHVQIYESHDSDGWVTYHSVWLDNARQDLNIRVFAGFALGWAPALLTNFQVDGNQSGSSYAQVYLDNLTVYRW